MYKTEHTKETLLAYIKKMLEDKRKSTKPRHMESPGIPNTSSRQG